MSIKKKTFPAHRVTVHRMRAVTKVLCIITKTARVIFPQKYKNLWTFYAEYCILYT